MGKKTTVEIRDLTIFSFIILLCLAVYAATVYLVLSNVTTLLLQLELYDAAVYVGYAGISAIIISVVLMVLYYFIIGTVLKRLNKSNQWKKQHVNDNTAS